MFNNSHWFQLPFKKSWGDSTNSHTELDDQFCPVLCNVDFCIHHWSIVSYLTDTRLTAQAHRCRTNDIPTGGGRQVLDQADQAEGWTDYPMIHR
jgi:hypothetical protein